MRFTKTVVAALVLSTALLVGCGQAPATDATQDEAAVEQTEPEAEPAMSNWQEGAFYDRPTSEIVSDLELLGFELTNEDSYDRGYAREQPRRGIGRDGPGLLHLREPRAPGGRDRVLPGDHRAEHRPHGRRHRVLPPRG